MRSVVQDSFCQILYMYLSEGVPVQTAHSGSGRTGLMAAAHHGLTETATQILQIGNVFVPASLHICVSLAR